MMLLESLIIRLIFFHISQEKTKTKTIIEHYDE